MTHNLCQRAPLNTQLKRRQQNDIFAFFAGLTGKVRWDRGCVVCVIYQ